MANDRSRRSYVPCRMQQQRRQRPVLSASAAASAFVLAGLLFGITTFTTSPANAFRTVFHQRFVSSSRRSESGFAVPVIETNDYQNHNMALLSSVGDGGNDGNGGDDKDDSDLGDFLDPMKQPDSEDMKRAREYMSETSLPISFDSVGVIEEDGIADGDPDEEGGGDEESKDSDFLMTGAERNAEAAKSSSLVSSSSSPGGNATSSALFGGSDSSSSSESKGPSPSLLAKNPYMQVVSKISPSDLIAKFTAESDPRVQEAVRTTILGLIGSLPKLAFETTSVTTGQRLASLVSEIL